MRSIWPAVQPLSRAAGSGAKAPGRQGDEIQTGRHTVKSHAEEDLTGSRLTSAEKEVTERSEERGNGGRVMGGKGTKHKGAG